MLRSKLLIIALIVHKISVQNVRFMVFSLFIQGDHKDHNVKMIKKAISEVKNTYMEKIGKLTSFQNDVVKGKEGMLRVIKTVNDRHIR